MANLQQFNIPVLVAGDAQNPTVAEVNAWATELNTTLGAVINLVGVFQLTVQQIPAPPMLAAGSTPAQAIAHAHTLTTYQGQLVIYQGQVFIEIANLFPRAPPPRATIKVLHPKFDGRPEYARAFHAGLINYR